MISVSYEREPCSRCGGSGHYSYNQISGTRCFKCGGSGKQLTKRGKAAKAFADQMLDARIEDYHDNHQGQQARYTDHLVGRRLTFSGTVEEEGTKVKSLGDTEWRISRSFNLLMNGNPSNHSLGAGIKVRMIPTEEQIAEIAAYQDNLTKAGTPRKKGA